MFTQKTKIGVLLYLLLALTAFLVPSDMMDATQFWFTLIIGIYVFIWLKILRYLWFYAVEDDDKYRWDFLAYDLIYMIGLGIIFNIMMIKVGRNLFDLTYLAYIYYGSFGFFLLMKIATMKSVSYHIWRFAIKWFFILGNVFVAYQIFRMWHGINNLGHGF